MKTLRVLLAAVLALALLGQGVAVAAAPHLLAAPAEAAAASAADLPCHGAAQDPVDAPSCCGSDCPDMASCVLGHLAPASAAAFELPRAQHAYATASARATRAAAPPSLLRPPIVSSD